MGTQEEIYDLLQQIADDLVALPAKLKLSASQITIVTGLSDLSENLGLLLAGEFRSGNSKDPGFGFSGMRMAWPTMTYESEEWNLVGVANDVLQFGVRASDGKAIAGAGAVTLDVDGITLDITQGGPTSPASIKYKNTITGDFIAKNSAYEILGGSIFMNSIDTTPYGDHAGGWYYISSISQFSQASITINAQSQPSPTLGGGVIRNAQINLNASTQNDGGLSQYEVIELIGTTFVSEGLWIGQGSGYAYYFGEQLPEIGVLWIKELAASAVTPVTGSGALYVKDDGSIYFKNDSGIEYRLNIGSVTSTQFLYNDASSDIAGYKQLLPNHSAAAKETLTFAGMTDAQVLEEFATEPNSPGTHFLYAGLYSVHIHALQSAGTKTGKVKAEIYKRTAGGTETLLGTTNTSAALTNSELPYELEVALSDIDVDLTDRLVVKFIGVVIGLGTDPTVSLFVEGDTSAHFSFPALTQGGTSNVNKQIVATDALIGSGLVVGNSSEANNPGNGEIWLQEQAALPAATGSVMKMINKDNSLFTVDKNGMALQFGADNGGWTFLDIPLVSASYAGNAFSTTVGDAILIDLSAVFGAPAGIKAVQLGVFVRDSASATVDTRVSFYTSATAGYAVGEVDCSGLANDQWERNYPVVKCNADGDIFYKVTASGVGTLDLYIRIYGYLLPPTNPALTAMAGRWKYLNAPLTAAAWNNQPYSTTGATLIDLSATFGVPAGVKAILARIVIRDSGSAAVVPPNELIFHLTPDPLVASPAYVRCDGVANDRWVEQTVVVPCNADGDLYYMLTASGVGTMDVIFRIWGYYYDNLDSQKWVYLQSPLTSTSWDGDAYSTTAKTLIDLSATFGVPAGVKAILASVLLRDAASAAGDYSLILSPTNVNSQGFYVACGGVANDKYAGGFGAIPCDSNGDIYYQITASGVGTMDIYLQIWGYQL